MAENRELALVLKLVADEFQKELKNSQGALSSFNNFIKDWRTQLAAAGTALFAIAKSTANYGDDLFKTSQKIGVQVEALAGLRHAAKLSDLDNQQLTLGLKTLSNSIVETARGTGDGREAFARLGLSVVDAQGKLRPTKDVLLELADVFSKSADGAGKTEAAAKLLGTRVGPEMIPFLNMGKAGIQDLMAEAEKLSLVMSEKDAKAAEEFNDSITRLEAQARGFSNTIGVHMLRPLTELMSLMNDLGSGPIADAAKFFFRGLNEQIVLFGTLVKEIGASIEFALGKSTFDELKTKIRLFEAEASAKLLLLENPEAAKYLDGPVKEGRSVEMGANKPQIPASAGAAKTKAVDHGKEQEELGKRLLEIYWSHNNALQIRGEIQERLGKQIVAVTQSELAAEQEQGEGQRRLGEQIVMNARNQWEATEERQARERDGLVKNLQAWIDYDNQVGASTELRYQHQLDLLRANLAQQLQITTEDAGKLLAAWENVESQKADAILSQTTLTAQERETIELQSLTRLAAVHQQYSGNVFQGWAMGLQRYLADTQSAFGFAADLARRTAQMMEGAFRSFFFDVMDNKIKSLKDLFSSFANFAKQIIAQVMAQLATMLVLKGITGGFGGGGFLSMFQGSGFGAAETPLFGFARGGPVLGAGNQDSVRAMLTPGEGVLNRKGMQALAQLNAGTAVSTPSPNVVINFHGVQANEQPQVNYRRQFEGLVVDVILKNRGLQAAMGWAR